MTPRILGSGQGRARDALGMPSRGKTASGDLSAGAAVLVRTVPPAGGATQNVRRETDQFFYVLDGELDVWIGSRRTKLVAGMSATLPRGMPHGFDNPGPRPAKVFVVETPGEGAAFFDAIDGERSAPPQHAAGNDADVPKPDLEFVI